MERTVGSVLYDAKSPIEGPWAFRSAHFASLRNSCSRGPVRNSLRSPTPHTICPVWFDRDPIAHKVDIPVRPKF
jgi:hypothetical protein